MSEANSSPKAKYLGTSEGQFFDLGENELGRLVDALAPRGDEGRDKLR